MDRDEWSSLAGNELDELASSGNHVLQSMVSDGSWEGTDPVEAARQVMRDLVAEETSEDIPIVQPLGDLKARGRLLLKYMDSNRPHWVCNDCLGDIECEQLALRLLGVEECEICKRLLPQPPLAYVGHLAYLKAKGRSNE